MKCNECRFYREGQDHASGECHGNAPSPLLWGASTAMLKGPLAAVYWPIVTPDDGCRQFEAAPKLYRPAPDILRPWAEYLSERQRDLLAAVLEMAESADAYEGDRGEMAALLADLEGSRR